MNESVLRPAAYVNSTGGKQVSMKEVYEVTSQSTVKPWGNSQGIRLSKSVLEEAGIEVNDTIQIEVRENTIILKKVFKHRTFEERLAEYDGKIDVQSFEWGEPAGREIL